MTIRKRLTLWYAGLLTLIIVLLGAVVFGIMRWTMIASIDSTLDETTTLVRNNSRLVIISEFGNQSHYSVQLPQLDFFRASGVEVQVWVKAGDEFEFVDSSANLVNYRIPLDEAALGQAAPVLNYITMNGAPWRVRTSPIAVGDQLIGNIQVAGSLQTVSQATNELFKVILVCCGLAIVSSSLLSMWLAGRMLRPIEDITSAAAHIAGTKDLSTRLPWNGPDDELGQLTSVFNQMMGRLERLFTVQQRFIADISHELRTPLTGICGNLEMIKRYGMDDESLNAINTDAERMSRLVNDLLLLARADYGGLPIDLYPLDLDSLVMEVFQQARGIMKNRQLELKMAHIEPLRIRGNGDRIKQMMLNLIDNSLKFTADGGSISVKLYRQDSNAVIEVYDTGTGIKSEDLDRIFDRFYQSDTARLNSGGGGFGLGLSIAKWISEAHGGSIRAESEWGKGATFIITLPLMIAPSQNGHDPSHDQITRPRIPALRRNREKSA